jgi:hypothetical protein
MGFDEEAHHCYFKKQPATGEEVERAARAVWASCCGAVQYVGEDPAIRRRITELHLKSAPGRRQPAKQKKPWWKFW